MNKKLKLLLSLLVFIFILIGTKFAYANLTKNADFSPSNMAVEEQEGTVGEASKSSSSEKESSTKEKTLAYDFTVTDASGAKAKLSDFIGKPIVLNFWASWCPPCKSEMPDFNEMYLEYGETVQFMMVNMTDGVRETLKKGQDYITTNDFSFPVFFDTMQEAAYEYQVTSIPTTLFIDKDGYIIAGAQGAIPKETLSEGIALIQPE